MIIPTEPIGSIPRPQKLITAFAQYEGGSLCQGEFESICGEAVRDTIEKFEATGSPVITDGEQTKPSFATYPIHGLSNLNPDGVKIQFADGHVRQIPKLSSGPFGIKPTPRPTFRRRRNLRAFRLSKRSFLPQRLACFIHPKLLLITRRRNFSKI
jgi:hypothetical protein